MGQSQGQVTEFRFLVISKESTASTEPPGSRRLLQDPGDSSMWEPGSALQEPGVWEDAATCITATVPFSWLPGEVS